MGPWMMGGFGGLGMILGLVLFLLFVGGVTWLVVALLRGTGSAAVQPRGDSPIDILQRRYASGEITKKQFEDMKRDLGA